MSFLVSWAWWFSIGVPVIVLLYLLKLRRHQASVPSLVFWQQILEETRSRALWQKLRRWLSLLLQLIIFALILLALAKPDFLSRSKAATATVVVLDDRARSQAKSEAGSIRFDEAIKDIRQQIQHVGPDHPLAIVGIAGGPRVLSPFVTDAAALSKTVGEFSPSDATGDDSQAMEMARNLLRSQNEASEPHVLRARPASVENAGITRFAARPLPGSPDTMELLLEIRNFGAKPVSLNAEVYLDERPLEVLPLNIPAGGLETKTFPALPSANAFIRGLLRARIDKSDALAADNEAFAVLPRQAPIRVLLLSSGNAFLERALRVNELVRFEQLPADQFNPELASRFDVLVFDREPPTGTDLDKLPANALLIATPQFALKDSPLKSPPVTDEDDGSPLLANLSMRSATFIDLRPLDTSTFPTEWKTRVVARSGDAAVVATLERSERRVAMYAFDITNSDLPLRVAFPLLIQNTIQWLAGRSILQSSQFQAGSMLTLAPDEQITTEPLRISAPLDPSAPLASAPFQLLKNGFYRVSGTSGERWLAVNTFSDSESDLRSQLSTEKLPGAASVGSSALISPIFPPWMLLALAALILSTVEWWLFHTRRTE